MFGQSKKIMMRTCGSALIDVNQHMEGFDESEQLPLISVDTVLRKEILKRSTEQY